MMYESLRKRASLMLLIASCLIRPYQTLLLDGQNTAEVTAESAKINPLFLNGTSSIRGIDKSLASNITGSVASGSSVAANGYLDKLDNLERSVAAVLIKVAYGTTSTTKRSIPDNSYVLGLTTAATPLLTTLRYQPAHQEQQNSNNRHRNYELDLERDHALPTSAPNADILKSNNNPTYPNPNRHDSHDRERHRHIYNSTPTPSLPNLLKKTSGQLPTIPMHQGDIPSYSPPSRSFFTPPLPPEYQNPFADKPTLRGTNNDGLIISTGSYINRRPIPPPSLMPGHERIPLRPPDLATSIGNNDANESVVEIKKSVSTSALGPFEVDRKKALNTPSRINDGGENERNRTFTHGQGNALKHFETADKNDDATNKRQEVLPNIRRILSGSNGKNSDIPEVLLKQVTQRPMISHHHPPSSPIVVIENVAKESNHEPFSPSSPNINKSRQTPHANNLGLMTNENLSSNDDKYRRSYKRGPAFSTSNTVSPGSTVTAAAASAHTTWAWAWNIHIYLSVILFTILSVYSLYKMITYSKLHLFSQSYFVCIHLIIICITRIFYLCFDAYNIHGSFHIFAAELLLNLPATFLTVSFSVLILFLFLKSLNHKNNRYSALIRPLTVVVGCGVHVVLCITLHYVESYTLQNHFMYLQQQQQHQYFRRHNVQQYQQLQQQRHKLVKMSLHIDFLKKSNFF